MHDQQRFWSWSFGAFLILVVGMLLVWRSTRLYPIADAYPLYFGAKAWLTTGNAYNLDAVIAPDRVDPAIDPDRQLKWYTNMHKLGNAYPLPAVMLFVPLSFLPVRMAALIWFTSLCIGMVCALRLLRISPLMIIYAPVNEAFNLEQYTLLVVIAQIVAVWAYLNQEQSRRAPVVLALACAVMCTKPTQGLVLAIVLLALTRNWRMIALAFGLVWGLPTLFDPGWVQEWLVSLSSYRALALPSLPWYYLLLALPLLWKRDILSLSVIVQFSINPFTSIYSASALPLGTGQNRRFYLLVLLSYLWRPMVILLLDRVPFSLEELRTFCAALTLILPAVVLASLQDQPLIQFPRSFKQPEQSVAP